MFESFITTKNNVLSFTDKLKKVDYIEKHIIDNSSLEQQIVNLQNGEFKIALIAPFSAGKSTFINSLIGQDLLSMEITAETSVITKISFSEDIKLQIKYRNGDIEMLPLEGEPALNVESVKELLEQKTTVKGDNTEDTIEEVKVYYPIEMCKDSVELVDTPGLFARHEKHKDITANILPTVNAVVFMIDPESVGEKHFTEVIQNYVRNAANSNMEKEGRHIFFVINKIDKFEKTDIEKAKKELITVLEGIIREPQVYEISAYYAMISKMYLAKTIDLDRIRKDRKIVIPDPKDPEYTLSGRYIEDVHVPIILNESRIRELEKGLENYLEEKNRYLLVNLGAQVYHIIEQSKSHKEKELENIRVLAQEDKAKFEKEINSLQTEIDSLEKNHKRTIHKVLTDRVIGGTGGSIQDNIRSGIKDSAVEVQQKLSREIYRSWLQIRPSITQSNAEERVSGLFNKIDTDIEIITKEMVKTSYEEFMIEMRELIALANEKINELKLDFERAELEAIGRELSSMQSYNLEGVEDSIKKIIENAFSDTLIDLARTISSSIQEAERSNTHNKERSGFFYGIKRFFTGRKEYDTTFDINGFKNEVEQLVNDMTETVVGRVGEIGNDVGEMLEKPVGDISKQVLSEVNSIITSLCNNKKSLINSILKNMKNNEKENQILIRKLERELVELDRLQEEYQTLEVEISQGA